ncbi:hypothetical protein GCM10009737_07980 [Nocardioides lentus]|uniref:DUF2303 family protein n=1 Tax=Nocardioides lentus TaxID=338077 RepID=A0ABN2P0W2_9ACTN
MSDVRNTEHTTDLEPQEFLAAASPRSEADAVADVARQAVEPQALDIAQRLHVLQVPAGGSAVVVDVEDYLDIYRDRPRRKKGKYDVHDAASLLAYLDKHGEEETEVWADLDSRTITAVLNAHTDRPLTEADAAGHGDHRVKLTVKLTDAWKRWAEHDGKLLEQSKFAELIEDGAADIVRPSGADMLEVAQTFQATIGVDFKSSRLLDSGERQLVYAESVEARAGRTGTVEIPKDFDLAIKPFEGGDTFRVLARFRYRISEGTLRIGYRLDRPADVLRDAFGSVVEQVREGCPHPVLLGASA